MKTLSLAAAALLVASQIGGAVAAPAPKAEERRSVVAQTASQQAGQPNRGTLRSLDVRGGQQGERASQGKANKGGNSIY